MGRDSNAASRQREPELRPSPPLWPLRLCGAFHVKHGSFPADQLSRSMITRLHDGTPMHGSGKYARDSLRRESLRDCASGRSEQQTGTGRRHREVGERTTLLDTREPFREALQESLDRRDGSAWTPERAAPSLARVVACVTIRPARLAVACTTSPRRSRVWTSADLPRSTGTDPCRHRPAALLRAPIRQRGGLPRAGVPRETSRVVRKTNDERPGPWPRQNSYDRRCPAGLPAQECNRGQLHTAEHSRLRPPIMVRPTPPQAGSAIVSGPHHRIEPMPRR